MKVCIEISNEDRSALAEILQAAAIIGCIPDDAAGVACMITLRHVRAVRALVCAIDDAVIEAERAQEDRNFKRLPKWATAQKGAG